MVLFAMRLDSNVAVPVPDSAIEPVKRPPLSVSAFETGNDAAVVPLADVVADSEIYCVASTSGKSRELRVLHMKSLEVALLVARVGPRAAFFAKHEERPNCLHSLDSSDILFTFNREGKSNMAASTV